MLTVRITICDRVPVREPIAVQPAGDADGVGLRELAGGGIVVAVALVLLPARIPHVVPQAAPPDADVRLRHVLVPRDRAPAGPGDGRASRRHAGWIVSPVPESSVAARPRRSRTGCACHALPT